MQKLLDDLQVPPEYSRYGDTLSEELVDDLDRWKQESHSQLFRLAALAEASELSLDERSLLAFRVAQYAGDGPWVSPQARVEAQSTCHHQTSKIHDMNELLQRS